jgi:hypothetical protein
MSSSTDVGKRYFHTPQMCSSSAASPLILLLSTPPPLGDVKDTSFKLWYTGNTSTKNGIGIVLDKSLKDEVMDIKRQGDRIILVKLLVGDLVFNVISAYALK